MTDEKEKHNYTGQTPSDIPSEELLNPPKHKHEKKENSKPGGNITAKDPNLGARNTTGR